MMNRLCILIFFLEFAIACASMAIAGAGLSIIAIWLSGVYFHIRRRARNSSCCLLLLTLLVLLVCKWSNSLDQFRLYACDALSFSLLFVRRLDPSDLRNDSAWQHDQSANVSLADVVGSGRDGRLSHIVSSDVDFVLRDIPTSNSNQAKLLSSKQSILTISSNSCFCFTGTAGMDESEHWIPFSRASHIQRSNL